MKAKIILIFSARVVLLVRTLLLLYIPAFQLLVLMYQHCSAAYQYVVCTWYVRTYVRIIYTCLYRCAGIACTDVQASLVPMYRHRSTALCIMHGVYVPAVRTYIFTPEKITDRAKDS